jgi:hypothetical protein
LTINGSSAVSGRRVEQPPDVITSRRYRLAFLYRVLFRVRVWIRRHILDLTRPRGQASRAACGSIRPRSPLPPVACAHGMGTIGPIRRSAIEISRPRPTGSAEVAPAARLNSNDFWRSAPTSPQEAGHALTARRCPAINFSIRYCTLRPTLQLSRFRQAAACPRAAQKSAMYRSLRSPQWQPWCRRQAQ